MVAAPGEKAAYCSAGVNLVGGALANVTHEPLLDLFRRYLADPLQITRYAINLMPSGQMYGGGGIRLRARDALKFGELYLDGGVWNGRRVVSKAWVDASLAEHATLRQDSSYGYNWWRYRLQVGDRVYDEYEAGGNGGQFIMIVPGARPRRRHHGRQLRTLRYSGTNSRPSCCRTPSCLPSQRCPDCRQLVVSRRCDATNVARTEV